MNIEIVEFYPIPSKKKKLMGTLHVYWIEACLDIRGILTSYNGSSWYFKFPSKKGIDPETGQEVFYPVLSFSDPNKWKEMIAQTRSKGIEYITDNFLNNKDGRMDKKIRQIEKSVKKSEKELKELEKMDKKQDKKLEKCDSKMMRKKK
jgi:hypothetical protein